MCNKEEHASPELKKAIQELINDAENEDLNEVKSILQLALDMDEKGEFWKFKEIFGTSEPNGSYEASEV